MYSIIGSVMLFIIYELIIKLYKRIRYGKDIPLGKMIVSPDMLRVIAKDLNKRYKNMRCVEVIGIVRNFNSFNTLEIQQLPLTEKEILKEEKSEEKNEKQVCGSKEPSNIPEKNEGRKKADAKSDS